MALGVGLVLGGMLGFLPILGVWMVPLGFLVLAADSPYIRRINRRVSVAVVGWWSGRKSKAERKAARARQTSRGRQAE
jgi:hypothetical protein